MSNDQNSTSPHHPITPSPHQSTTSDFLDRPHEQRVREYKYRFAQTVVFGLPVLALHFFGPFLGGSEIERNRWLGILQLILTGWIIYVGAAGMILEGAIVLIERKNLSADLLVAMLAIGLFIASAISVLHVFKDGQLWFQPLLFAWAVALLAGWNAFRWKQMRNP